MIVVRSIYRVKDAQKTNFVQTAIAPFVSLIGECPTLGFRQQNGRKPFKHQFSMFSCCTVRRSWRLSVLYVEQMCRTTRWYLECALNLLKCFRQHLLPSENLQRLRSVQRGMQFPSSSKRKLFKSVANYPNCYI